MMPCKPIYIRLARHRFFAKKITYFNPKSKKSLLNTADIFREYQAYLGVDLCFQSFENELNNLQTIYKKQRVI